MERRSPDRSRGEERRRPRFAALTLLEGAVVRSTRIYARRQRTWIRDVPLVWIDPSLLGKRC